MKNYFILLCVIIISFGNKVEAKNRRGAYQAERTTTEYLGETNYDIKHLIFNLKITDTSTFIIGDVTTFAKVSADSLSAYYFELDSTITIDSAKFNGVATYIVNLGNLRQINLIPALPFNAYFKAEIFYHGTPSASGGFFNALSHDTSTHGTHMVYSLSDPYAAKNWWPAKQDIDDKIDTVDMFVTVPRGVVDGSNGVLLSVDSVSIPGFWQYHWQTHYPIDYYLISIAVSKFVEYKYYHHFAGSTDSMLLQNFFIDTATFNPAYKANFDSIGVIIDYYDSLFGRYPFWKEKYGVCYTTLPGGMEHQTMTTIGVPNTYIIAHELCHQWFGDHVTYATWGDVWLSEGFATFSEQLFLSRFWGPSIGLAHRRIYYNDAMSAPCGSLFVTDTSGPTPIFNFSTVYEKGQALVNMLRYAAPVDSLFFTVLKTYQQMYGFSNANTQALKAIADSIYGTNLDTFFNQWVYGQGYPQYKISWNQVGTQVYIQLIQIPSCPGSVSLFKTFLELQLHGAATDTFVKVYNNADTQLYVFNWADSMSTVKLNPDVWTLCQTMGAVVHNPTLGIGAILPSQFKIFPNPTENYWQIDEMPENMSLILTNESGKRVWKGRSKKGTTFIPAKELEPGTYFLNMNYEEQKITLKLERW